MSADGIAVACLALLGTALVVLTWGTWGDVGRDTGFDLVAGARVAHGQLPYADFPYYYGPIAPLLLGLAAWIGGDGLTPAIVLGLIVSALIVVLTYALARTFVGAVGAFLASAIVLGVAVSPTNLSYVLPHTEAMTLGIAALLALLLALARMPSPATSGRLVAAGAALGVVALTKPELEAAAVAAVAAWCAARRLSLRGIAAVAAPAVGIPVFVYGAFATQVSIHALVFENLYPTRVLHAGGDKILRLHAPLTIPSLVHHAEHIVLYAAGIGTMFTLAWLIDRSPRSLRFLYAVVALVAAEIALTNLEATRSALQLVYGWIPGGAAIAAILLATVFRREKGAGGALALTVALAIAGGTTYAAFYFHATHAQTAVYFAPLAAVFLAALHLRALVDSRTIALLGTCWLAFLAATGVALAVDDARAETAVVSGPGGSINVGTGDANAYRGALADIVRLTKPAEPVLIAPQLATLYTLSGRTDALPNISLLPGMLGGVPAEQQAIARLKAAHVQLIVTDQHELTEYGQGAFGSSFDTTLATWVARNFERSRTFRGQSHTLVVWRRNTP